MASVCVQRWHGDWYVGKSGAHQGLDMIVLGRQSCYLLGRDRAVVDIPTEHPSCSKQHAVIQFRQVTKRNEFGDTRRHVQCVFFYVPKNALAGTYAGPSYLIWNPRTDPP